MLGDVPQKHGLAKSLFTRLHEFYNQHGLPVAVLNTNYRCHKSIVSLAKSLFYSPDLEACAKPPSIPGVKQPLWFVCSSLENKAPPADKEIDQREVKALIDQLNRFFPYPGQLEDVCIMASNRRQAS